MFLFKKICMIGLKIGGRVNSNVFMVDAADSKFAGSDTVRVRVSPWVHLEQSTVVLEKKLPVLIKI